MSHPIVHVTFRNIVRPDGLYLHAGDLMAAFESLAEAVKDEERASPQLRKEIARGYRAAARRIKSIIEESQAT